MKSRTILNQNKIHAFIFALTTVTLMMPQAAIGFGCPTDHSSCIVSRYANTTPIVLRTDNQTNIPGDPSPSTILVNNIPKCHVVKGLEVSLNILYGAANVLSVALLSPCGDCIILLNDVGADGAVIGGERGPGTLVFSDCKGEPIPCDIATTIVEADTTITVQPTDCDPGSYCFNGALDTTFCSTKLSKTFGKPAVGCWQLFTCIKPGANTGGNGEINSWKLRIIHGLRAKDGCFDLFTSNCCGPCVC